MFQIKERCKTVGERAFLEDKKNYQNGTFEDIEYAYNSKLNTCLYSTTYREEGFWEKEEGNWESWVKDSLTNKKVAEVDTYMRDTLGRDTWRKWVEDYGKKRADLLGH